MTASTEAEDRPGAPRRAGLALAILAAAAGAFWLLTASRPQAPAAATSEQIWRVEAATAALEELTPEVTLYGRIESPRQSQLSAALAAFVETVPAQEGNQVQAGDLLVALDDRDARLIVAQRQAQLAAIQAQIAAEHTRHRADQEALAAEQALLALAERSVARYQALAGRQVGSEIQLDDARRNYQQQRLALNSRTRAIDDHGNRLQQLKAQQQQAQAQLDAARLDLERARVRAPFAGWISRVQVAPGDRVRSGDPLVTLFSSDALEVRTQIPSHYLGSLRKALAEGQHLGATSRLEGRTLHLKLDRLAAQVSASQAGVDGLLRFTHPAAGLTLGRTLTLILQLPPERGLLALPPQALYGLDRIYRIQQGRLEALPVTRIGEQYLEGTRRVLVRSDQVQPGDRILITQLPNAISGLRVQTDMPDDGRTTQSPAGSDPVRQP